MACQVLIMSENKIQTQETSEVCVKDDAMGIKFE